jgi:hypothetical protein
MTGTAPIRRCNVGFSEYAAVELGEDTVAIGLADAQVKAKRVAITIVLDSRS